MKLRSSSRCIIQLDNDDQLTDNNVRASIVYLSKDKVWFWFLNESG